MSDARLLLARHRRWFAAAFAAAATGFALLSLHPPAPPSVRVLAAARDLPAGAVLRPADLRAVAVPASVAPDGAVRSRAAGRILAGPMRKGEPLTDARLLRGGLLQGYGSGVVATPIRIADAGAARLLRPGDRVDVLATGVVDGAATGPGAAASGDDVDGRAGGPTGGPAGGPPDTGSGGASGDRSTPTGTPGDPTDEPMPSSRTDAPGDQTGVPPGGPPAGALDPDLAGDLAGDLAPAAPARLVAASVPVVTVPRPRSGDDAGEGAIVVLATTRRQAAVLAGLDGRLSVTVVAGPAG